MKTIQEFLLLSLDGAVMGRTKASSRKEACENFKKEHVLPCYQVEEWCYSSSEESETFFNSDPSFYELDFGMTVTEANP